MVQNNSEMYESHETGEPGVPADTTEAYEIGGGYESEAYDGSGGGYESEAYDAGDPAGDTDISADGRDAYADEDESMPPINPDIKWYVIHTYSGYENKVKANIEKVIENRAMQDVILDIVVPMEEQIEIKEGRKKVTLRKVFPGYVLIKMLMTDETWYVVRNTRGVTGFVGPGSRPVPLSEDEVKAMGVEEFLPVVDYEIGDNVRVADGPLESFIGIVEDINMEKKKVRVLVSMFGRETPVELELVQIQKLQ
jgi:transcriptional antiterminator NusG